MSGKNDLDPMAMMRAAVDQWEKLANEYGGQFLGLPETGQAMQKMSAGFLHMQKVTQDGMAKALAAANLPSRMDVEALSARLGAIEAVLARIEAAAAAPIRSIDAPPRPPRTRKPPSP